MIVLVVFLTPYLQCFFLFKIEIMSLNGYVKLFRSLKEWEWYDDTNVKILFLDILLSVNFKDTKWKGNDIKRGQFIIGLGKYARGLGLTLQELRTALKKLRSTGEITTRATNKNTIITLVNFEGYQDKKEKSNTPNNKPITDEQQTNNKPITDEQQQRKKDKKNKEEKELKNKEIVSFPFLEEVKEILLFFVSETGKQLIFKKLKTSDKYKTIMPRLKGGATVDECKAVISLKSKQWKNDKKMRTHLCIPTLFGVRNFEKYLDELGSAKPVVKKFPYPLPEFLDKEDRQSYFYLRYDSYKQHLDIQKVNTIYKKRALYEQDAEGLCFELELKIPKLAEIQVNYNRL